LEKYERQILKNRTEAATGDQSGSPGCANQGSEGVEKMKQTIEANNKAIVLEAFDIELFVDGGRAQI
jgi:TPP-dependent indolepyruvate ferredoxin oxidoreductase alpha subunit